MAYKPAADSNSKVTLLGPFASGSSGFKTGAYQMRNAKSHDPRFAKFSFLAAAGVAPVLKPVSPANGPLCHSAFHKCWRFSSNATTKSPFSVITGLCHHDVTTEFLYRKEQEFRITMEVESSVIQVYRDLPVETGQNERMMTRSPCQLTQRISRTMR